MRSLYLTKSLKYNIIVNNRAVAQQLAKNENTDEQWNTLFSVEISEISCQNYTTTKHSVSSFRNKYNYFSIFLQLKWNFSDVFILV